MNKLASIFMTALLFTSFIGATYALQEGDKPLGGKALLEQNQKQIELLKEKLEELKSAGGDTTVVEGFIEVAEEMMELNNERHALHEATKSFAEAVGAFSKKIEWIIQTVNGILDHQAEAAIKNAHAVALLKPHNDSKEEDHK
jgi:ABC-type transporter Mla subunit MlaD